MDGWGTPRLDVGSAPQLDSQTLARLSPPDRTLRKSSWVSGQGPSVVSVLMEGRAGSAVAMADRCPPTSGLCSCGCLVGSEAQRAPEGSSLPQLIGCGP